MNTQNALPRDKRTAAGHRCNASKPLQQRCGFILYGRARFHAVTIASLTSCGKQKGSAPPGRL
jgi:hypothetical protein